MPLDNENEQIKLAYVNFETMLPRNARNEYFYGKIRKKVN